MNPETTPSRLRPPLAITVLALLLGGAAPLPADTLQVEFTGRVTGYSGPDVIKNQILTTPPLIFEGQFNVNNFTPGASGTFSLGDPGVEFLLHSQQLERIEAITLRRPDNTKVLLPRTGTAGDPFGTSFFGAGSLEVVNGVPVSLSYTIGRGALSTFDFIFAAAGIPEIGLFEISLGGTTFTDLGRFDLSDPASGGLPYGFNVPHYDPLIFLDTDKDTTRAEAGDPALGVGRRLSQGGAPNPFAPGGPTALLDTGFLYRYSTDALQARVVGGVIPEPGTVAAGAMLALAGAGLGWRRFRRQ